MENVYKTLLQFTFILAILPQISTQIPEISWVPIMNGLLPNLSMNRKATKKATNSTNTFNVKLRYTLPASFNVADANVKP